MMAKLRFGRSSRATPETNTGDCIQRIDHLKSDNKEATFDNINTNLSSNDTPSSYDNRQPNIKKPAQIGHKSERKGRYSALRLFYHSSPKPTLASTSRAAAQEPESTSHSSTSSAADNKMTNKLPPSSAISPPSASSSPNTSSTTDSNPPSKISPKSSLTLESKAKEHRAKKADKREKKQDSKTTRLFSSPTQSTSDSPAVATTKTGKQPNVVTNSSDKKVISLPMPPYELEVTDIDGCPYVECPLCVLLVNYSTTPDLKSCGHRTCLECMQRYLKTEINHSRLKITCPSCPEPLQQQVIRQILQDDKFYFKYESFMLRKVLAAEPDARWCPAPDCGYAVLATGCASCPRLVCGRNGCNTEFCYHCKQEWHPNQTCSAASIQRNKRTGFVLNAFYMSDIISSADDNDSIDETGIANQVTDDDTKDHAGKSRKKIRRKSLIASQQQAHASNNSNSLRPEDIKECPVCSSRIIKMNDGSCNHMTCSICETDFCWLCMKEISDLHYFSPSGCTFWGKKPWSRKKKLLWRLGMLVGAPICIVFIAGIAVPAIVIGIPVWAARKLHTRLEKKQFSQYRKNAIITGGVLLSFIISPIISAMALAVGIPILLGYVYGVVPLSLCRSSGGCLSPSHSVDNMSDGQQHNIISASNRTVATHSRDRVVQRSHIQAAQQEFRRQQVKSDSSMKRSNAKQSHGLSCAQVTPAQFSDAASVGCVSNSKLKQMDSGGSMCGTNQGTGESIGEPSLYLSNVSLETNSAGIITNIVDRASRNSSDEVVACCLSTNGCDDPESASNVALSGSMASHKLEDANSTRALAGSIISKDSGGYTLIPAEVHAAAAPGIG